MTGQDPTDDFRSGNESRADVALEDVLRRMPRFEPPARMKVEFLAMLDEIPAAASAASATSAASTATGFEPPKRLRATVLDEFERQQAAQSPRREAVLREIARGIEPGAVLGAPLSPAGDRWLRARATETRREPSAPRRPARARPFGTWRLAAGGLMALLALGVGLRVILDTSSSADPELDTYARSAASAPAAASKLSEAPALPPPPLERAPAPPGPLAAAPSGTRSAVHADRPALSAPESERRSARAMASRDREFEAASKRAERAVDERSEEAGRAAQAVSLAKQWKLSDDPIARLSNLPAGSNWIVLYNPADAKQADDWLQRGVRGTQSEPIRGQDAPQPHDSAHAREPARLSSQTQARASLKLQPREAIPTGSLRVLPVD